MNNDNKLREYLSSLSKEKREEWFTKFEIACRAELKKRGIAI